MVIFFSVNRLKIESLGIELLIEWKLMREKGVNKVVLRSTRFFENTDNLLDYIENNGLMRENENADGNTENMNKRYKLVDQIKDYCAGKEISLSMRAKKFNLFNLEELFSTVFSKKVITYLIDNVQYGETISYSGIGKGINSRAYQAIGMVLKNNPLPLIIPCHRVIRKDGTIGGFMGKAQKKNAWQITLKEKLLELEDIYT